MYEVEFTEETPGSWFWKVYKKSKGGIISEEFSSLKTYSRKDVARKAFRDRDIRINGIRIVEK